tara:strand:- start:247 stop:555 length:309 start_codon:yes stop_codon:yes gene_type:complete
MKDVDIKLNGIPLDDLMKYAHKEMDDDLVNHPAHYNNGKIECIEAIEAMLTHEEFIGYLRGNSLKYRWRFRYKNGIQDLDKADWYENKLKQILKERSTNETG